MKMRFPKRTGRAAVLGLVSMCALSATALGAVPAAAADGPLHRVRYTVTTDVPFYADIYFREVDPPDWAAYSHNPYEFTPKVEAQVGPDQPWVREVMLADPRSWAMVVPTSGLNPLTPNFHCTLEIDGAVVKTDTGLKGALCSLRNW
jgi:hypothetical protein